MRVCSPETTYLRATMSSGCSTCRLAAVSRAPPSERSSFRRHAGAQRCASTWCAADSAATGHSSCAGAKRDPFLREQGFDFIHPCFVSCVRISPPSNVSAGAADGTRGHPAVHQESDPPKFGRSPHNRRTSCPPARGLGQPLPASGVHVPAAIRAKLGPVWASRPARCRCCQSRMRLSTCRRILERTSSWRGRGIRTPANASPSSWSQPQPTAADPIEMGLACTEPRIGAGRGRLFRSGLTTSCCVRGRD
jgi:hypothetical protein